MLTTIEHELRDPSDNTDVEIRQVVTLMETEIGFSASNFHPGYFVPSFPDEDVENVDEDLSQAYFWSEEWQKAESEASEDIKLGRVKTFNSVQDLIAELRS